MFSRLSLLLGLAASGALLTSCGGSNNDPTPTPTPTGTGTSTPTPTPTATATPEPADFSFTEDFTTNSGGIYILAYFTPGSGGDEVFSDATRFTSGTSEIAFAVDPEQITYRFRGENTLYAFNASDLVTDNATLREYMNNSGRLILEVPYANVLRASLQRTDPFVRETVAGDLRSRRVTLFINPVTTDDALTGTLTYTGEPSVVGGTSGTTASNAISASSSTFTVDSTGPVLNGTIRIFETVNGAQVQRATLTFASTQNSGAAYSGTVTDTPNGLTGQFAAALAGPDREELALIFAVSDSDGRKYVGSFIGS